MNESHASGAALVAIIDVLPQAIAAVDASGAIIAANARFRELEKTIGEESAQIDDGRGATIPLRVGLRRAAQGHELAFTYRSISADQKVKVYRGRATPLDGEGRARSVIEMTPLE